MSLLNNYVFDRVVALFEGDKVLAQAWLHEGNRALGWKTPIEMLSSQTGTDEVIRLLLRLEHGIYS